MITINDAIGGLSNRFNIEEAALKAFIEVESGGQGFDSVTGKLIIQFEPTWFRKKEPYAPSGLWSLNGVERQKQEWLAFEDARKISEMSAMESTSIGLGQIMAYHWERLGYTSVYGMWHDAESGIYQQVLQICLFIDTDPKLKSALIGKDWPVVATIYNGPKYKEMAKKLGRKPYDVSMSEAYNNYTNYVK